MNKNLHVALGAVILGTISQIASAGDAPMGLSVRAGAAFSLNRSKVTLSTLKTYESTKINISGGIDYTLGEIGTDLVDGQRCTWGASVDYQGNGTRYNIPILANFHGKMDQFEYSAGVGIGFGRAFNTTSKDFKSVTGFAYQLSGRYYFQKSSENPMFVEVRYYGSNKSELNGLALQLGISL